MKTWARSTGELPMRKRVLEDAEFISNNPRLAPFVEQLPYGFASVKKDEGTYKQAILDAVDEVLLNDMKPADALAEAAQRVNRMLEEE